VAWYNAEHRHSGIRFVTPDHLVRGARRDALVRKCSGLVLAVLTGQAEVDIPAGRELLALPDGIHVLQAAVLALVTVAGRHWVPCA
jgi:hypothetical protein